MTANIVKNTKIAKLKQPTRSVEGTFQRARAKANSQAWTRIVIIGENADGSGCTCHSNMGDNQAIGLLEKAKHALLREACDG